MSREQADRCSPNNELIIDNSDVNEAISLNLSVLMM